MRLITQHAPTAISFDSATFRDAQAFFPELDRIDPYQFLSEPIKLRRSYINLVLQDPVLRKQVDVGLSSADKCTLIALSQLPPRVTVGQGCLIYPNVTLYPGCRIANDVIIHSNTAVGHDCEIEDHCFISGGVMIGGSTTLGSWCKVMVGAVIVDKVIICDDVTISAGSVVRHNIIKPGTYANTLGHMKQIK